MLKIKTKFYPFQIIGKSLNLLVKAFFCLPGSHTKWLLTESSVCSETLSISLNMHEGIMIASRSLCYNLDGK